LYYKADRCLASEWLGAEISYGYDLLCTDAPAQIQMLISAVAMVVAAETAISNIFSIPQNKPDTNEFLSRVSNPSSINIKNIVRCVFTLNKICVFGGGLA